MDFAFLKDETQRLAFSDAPHAVAGVIKQSYVGVNLQPHAVR